MDSEEKNYGGHKVSVLHIIYSAIILCLLGVFILLIAPGRINDNAFTNFSFAATLISIVLAVVSIVYSLLSGLSNNSYKTRMDEIQKTISDRMHDLNSIELSLQNLVEEHKLNLRGNAKINDNNIEASSKKES